MATSEFPVAPPGASTIPVRVAELEAMLARVLIVQERMVAALDRLAPAAPAPMPTRPPLRVVR